MTKRDSDTTIDMESPPVYRLLEPQVIPLQRPNERPNDTLDTLSQSRIPVWRALALEAVDPEVGLEVSGADPAASTLGLWSSIAV